MRSKDLQFNLIPFTTDKHYGKVSCRMWHPCELEDLYFYWANGKSSKKKPNILDYSRNKRNNIKSELGIDHMKFSKSIWNFHDIVNSSNLKPFTRQKTETYFLGFLLSSLQAHKKQWTISNHFIIKKTSHFYWSHSLTDLSCSVHNLLLTKLCILCK